MNNNVFVQLTAGNTVQSAFSNSS